MAHYVIDSTIVMHYLLNQVYTINAEAFFDQVAHDDLIIVPEFCLIECTNVIWKQVRFYGMSRTDGSELLKMLRTLPLKRAAVKQMLDQALELGLNHQLPYTTPSTSHWRGSLAIRSSPSITHKCVPQPQKA